MTAARRNALAWAAAAMSIGAGLLWPHTAIGIAIPITCTAYCAWHLYTTWREVES